MTLQRYCIKLQRICRNIKIVLHKPQIRNPTKSLRACNLLVDGNRC